MNDSASAYSALENVFKNSKVFNDGFSFVFTINSKSKSVTKEIISILVNVFTEKEEQININPCNLYYYQPEDMENLRL